MEDLLSTTGYDYDRRLKNAALSKELREYEQQIQSLRRGIAMSTLAIGKILYAAHGKLAAVGSAGEFTPWLRDAAEFTYKTAMRKIEIYKAFRRCNQDAVARFNDDALLMLTEEGDHVAEARRKALRRAANNEKITVAVVREIISQISNESHERDPVPEGVVASVARQVADKHVEATENDLARLAEYDSQSQRQIVKEVREEGSALAEILDRAEREPTVDEERVHYNEALNYFCRELKKWCKRNMPESVWMDQKQQQIFYDQMTMATAVIKGCHAIICPKCKGEKCIDCRQSGYCTKVIAETLKGS